jgi:DNA-directed RNA polymerase subunit RPC12/RpoP
MWKCSDCEVENDLDPEAEEGQIIECMECSAEFEILGFKPLGLKQLDIASSDEGAETGGGWDDE